MLFLVRYKVPTKSLQNPDTRLYPNISKHTIYSKSLLILTSLLHLAVLNIILVQFSCLPCVLQVHIFHAPHLWSFHGNVTIPITMLNLTLVSNFPLPALSEFQIFHWCVVPQIREALVISLLAKWWNVLKKRALVATKTTTVYWPCICSFSVYIHSINCSAKSARRENVKPSLPALEMATQSYMADSGFISTRRSNERVHPEGEVANQQITKNCLLGHIK